MENLNGYPVEKYLEQWSASFYLSVPFSSLFLQKSLLMSKITTILDYVLSYNNTKY